MSLKKLCFLFLLLPGLALGKAPETIYPGKFQTQTFENLAQLYVQVYDDTHKEPGVEILARVKQRNLSSDTELPLGVLDESTMTSFCQLEVPDVSKEKSLSLAQHDKASKRLRELCEQERAFLREENNLARRAGLRSILNNGDLSDSPFDLVADLNDLDVLLFGEKHEIPDPAFPKASAGWKQEDQELVLGDFDATREQEPVAWMNQRSDEYDYDEEPKYSEEDNSIMSHMQNLLRPLNTLELYSLSAGCHAMRSMEPTHIEKLPGLRRLSVMHNLGSPVHINPVPITKNRTLERGHEKEGWGETPTDFVDKELPFGAFLAQEALILDEPECIQRIKNFGSIAYEEGVKDYLTDQEVCEEDEKARNIFQYRQQKQKQELFLLEQDHYQGIRALKHFKGEIAAFFHLTKSVEAIMGKLSKVPTFP